MNDTSSPTPESSPEVASALPLEEAQLAPGVERLERPSGTSKNIPDTIARNSPSPAFLVVVAAASFAADVASKLWAEQRLTAEPTHSITLSEASLRLSLAQNKGGAFGLLHEESENVRRPFFLLISAAAVLFILSLYRKLSPQQHALKWGLPLVLGGALGNLFDRIRYGYVIDFIDYRADWVRKFNELVLKVFPKHFVTDHWPTFNIADVAICIGVGLMAVDMMTSRRGRPRALATQADVPLEPEAHETTEPAAEEMNPATTDSATPPNESV